MIKFIREMVKVVVDQALMPTGKNLVPTIIFASGITVMEIVFTVLHFPHILKWQGCLLAAIVLAGILILERSEYNAISKLYRDAELRVKDLKERQQAAGARIKDARTRGVPPRFTGDNDGGADQ